MKYNDHIYVIAPIYKVEPYLRRCVDSILNQTYQNFKLILVDDGSPDKCGAICDEYASRDERIHVIHQDNGGLSSARNTGIGYAFAHGDPEKDWVSFIDSDDFVHPRYLEYLYRAARETGSDISSCGYVRTSESEIPDEEPPFSCTSISPELFWQKDRTNALIAPAKLYRLTYFTAIRFPVGKLHEDEFTTYRALFACDQIVVLKHPMYYYYFNSASITHSEWNPRRLDGLDALEAQMDYFRDRDFPGAYRYSARDLFQHSIKHVMYMKHASPKYDHLLPEVKKRSHRAFRLYAKAVGWRKALSYWYQIRIIIPIKRTLARESAWAFLKRRFRQKIGRR